VLPAGRRLRGQELGALAELGRAQVRVRPAPTVAVLATGDELVPVDVQPGPGQIRNSNETMLVAQVTQAGGRPVPLGIARDTKESLRERLSEGLRHDLLLLSGGVSAGKLDLVPTVLRELGVEQVFHKVQVKPGQPLWFGRRERAGNAGPCFVFGLPGNPVSSMVCFELFARTALRKRMGDPHPEPQPVSARLTHDFTHTGNRPTYHPAKLAFTPRGPEVSTVPWIGSADICATVAANAMAVFPAGDAVHPAGAMLNVIPW
jgi:molybdopterin molybdotransferase